MVYLPFILAVIIGFCVPQAAVVAPLIVLLGFTSSIIVIRAETRMR